uniref:RING-type domain-containing protein n=1 Tax=Oryza nivara TaxID=4536 RepID=A0A0E0H527_ORYNI
MARSCSSSGSDHSSYDLALTLRRKLLLLLDILAVLRFLAAALLERLGVVSCQEDNELPGCHSWCDSDVVDTGAMERLMQAKLSTSWYRLRRRASRGGSDNMASPHGDTSADICTICLAELEAGGGGGGCQRQVVELSSCSHAFHAACIDGWVVEAGTCPLCRTPVLPPWQMAA